MQILERRREKKEAAGMGDDLSEIEIAATARLC
jgi:hypothetical protein